MKHSYYLLLLSLTLFISCKKDAKYDIIIKNGIVYDGNGGEPQKIDIAIKADTIAFIGDLSNEIAKQILDAKGMAVAPGFVNMLSWSTETLIQDGRSLGEITQGVTLEVMGEGDSMGPLSDSMKIDFQKSQIAQKSISKLSQDSEAAQCYSEFCDEYITYLQIVK